jgi:glutathione S-transferase
MPDPTLYADASWMSPWVFHALVALEELRLPYRVEPLRFPIAADVRDDLQRHALLGKVPCLRDGDVWLTESSAISEYLAERYAPPAFPRILPADLVERARARQLMSWLRTSLMALRDERPTTSVFGRPLTAPLGDKARRDADELVRVAEHAIAPGRTTIAAEWCMADADLALMLMRLIGNGDAVPARIVDYTTAQWERRSVRTYLGFVPTAV